MLKPLLFAAAIAAVALPQAAKAQYPTRRAPDMSAHQHYGGHYRHMHRDWSYQTGRPNVCWEWTGYEWQWMC
jgi:hypothetical protein